MSAGAITCLRVRVRHNAQSFHNKRLGTLPTYEVSVPLPNESVHSLAHATTMSTVLAVFSVCPTSERVAYSLVPELVLHERRVRSVTWQARAVTQKYARKAH